MQEYTKEQILKIVQDEDVEFVRLQFTDMYGSLKNIAVTARELVNALDYKRSIDGSFMAGIAKEHDPTCFFIRSFPHLRFFRGGPRKQK